MTEEGGPTPTYDSLRKRVGTGRNAQMPTYRDWRSISIGTWLLTVGAVGMTIAGPVQMLRHGRVGFAVQRCGGSPADPFCVGRHVHESLLGASNGWAALASIVLAAAICVVRRFRRRAELSAAQAADHAYAESLPRVVARTSFGTVVVIALLAVAALYGHLAIAPQPNVQPGVVTEALKAEGYVYLTGPLPDYRGVTVDGTLLRSERQVDEKCILQLRQSTEVYVDVLCPSTPRSQSWTVTMKP